MSIVSNKSELIKRLDASLSPVERDIAAMLKKVATRGAEYRLYRYHCKIDIAKRLMEDYDAKIEKPISDKSVSVDGYLGLAQVFASSACACDANDEAYARRLLWLNSAFNCLDHLKLEHRDSESDFEKGLYRLLQDVYEA